MDPAIFSHSDYKAFISARLSTLPRKGRGARRQIAEAMGCQTAYVSHVLAGDRHLSLEQAEALARFFGLRNDETEFFLNLVAYNRAGTEGLRKLLSLQLENRRNQYQQLKARVGIKREISSHDQTTYYSSWHYQAVRMAITIPELQTIPSLSKRLQLPTRRIQEVLHFLLDRGLAREEKGKYVTTDALIHLPGDSPLISKLHSNWRVHALSSFDRESANDLHYSGVVTLAEKDFQKVREIFTKALVAGFDVIRPSKEERLCVLNLDFYNL